MDKFDFFGPNLLPKKLKFEIHRTVGIQICLKRKLGFEIQKTNVAIRISMLEIPCVPIFRWNRQLWLFGPKFAEKLMLGSEFQKSNSTFGINTSTLSCEPIFSQNEQHLVFQPKFGEIAQLRAIFWFKYCWGCCRELGGGWNELGGGGWRWVHSSVISFDDIFKNYTPVMLHSQWHYLPSSLHKGYRWYKVPSHTISRSWDTSKGGGKGVYPPYPLLPISHVCPCITPVHKLFAQLCCCLGLQLHWR